MLIARSVHPLPGEAELKERLGHGGATRRAADYLLEVLEARPQRTLRTHYQFTDRSAELVRGAA